MENQVITKEEARQERAIVPYDDIVKMAQALGKGKLFGKTAEELLPLMLIAQAEGKHPAIAAQEYDIIQGKPAINSRSTLARFQAAGGKIGWLERTDEKASAEFTHPSCTRPLTITWDMARAKQAGLTGKNNWKTYPAQMLSARVIAEGVRACFPACLSGLYTAEEVQDMSLPAQTESEPRNITETETTKKANEPAKTGEAVAYVTGSPQASAKALFDTSDWTGLETTKKKFIETELTSGLAAERAEQLINIMNNWHLPTIF